MKSPTSPVRSCPCLWSHCHHGCLGHAPHPGLPISPFPWQQCCSSHICCVADDIRFEDKYLMSEQGASVSWMKPAHSAISVSILALPGSSFLNQSAFCVPSSTRSQGTIKAEDQYICTGYCYRIWSFSEQTMSVKLILLW